jgi:CheY-like chemotaxis protein
MTNFFIMPTNITCLLIDDDSDDREIFGDALHHTGLDVEYVTMTDSINAIEVLKENTDFTPVLIVVDFNMPKMNGIECLVELKKIPRIKDVPIYLYSTYVHPEIIKKGKELGAKDVLIKARNMKDLEAEIIRILPTQKLGYAS